jgi:hypothetical protein
MKKLLLITLVLALISCLFPGETRGTDNPQSTTHINHVTFDDSGALLHRPPEYSFNIEPLPIMASWYDYFPGGFTSIPIRLQPSPAGMHPGGGLYFAYQASPSAGSLRNIYYSYSEDGMITAGPSLIDLNPSSSPGFPSIDIDQDSGDPFVAWHSDSGIYLSCDQYSLMGFPGLWNEPYLVLAEAENPLLFIGDSPHNGEKRLHIFATSYEDDPDGIPQQVLRLIYADYNNPTDLAVYNPAQWTEVIIPYLDIWNAAGVRTFCTPVVSRDSGYVALVGHTQKLDTNDPYHPDNILFVLENDNYGDGDWTLFIGDPTIPVANPDNYFLDDSNQPYQDMRYTIYMNRHNAIIDDQGNYHFQGMFALFAEDNSWFPSMTTTKHVKFERNTETFYLKDIFPRHEDGESLYLPWSIPPEFDNNGSLIINPSWPVYWPDPEDAYHENYFRIVQRDNKLIALFQTYAITSSDNSSSADSGGSRSAVNTLIFLSADYGESWSEAINLNSSETPELSGMLPVYWYLADSVEHLYDDWHRIHLMFFDDNDFGSSILGNGPATGGTIMYTSLDLDFTWSPPPYAEEIVTIPSGMLDQNFPNPFNPDTTIRFLLPDEMQVSLQIYNLKGQLITTLIDDYLVSGEHYSVWNGKDSNNKPVASGIYLYRLSTDKQTETRKMLLIK